MDQGLLRLHQLGLVLVQELERQFEHLLGELIGLKVPELLLERA
jgi:hypothetical protein